MPEVESSSSLQLIHAVGGGYTAQHSALPDPGKAPPPRQEETLQANGNRAVGGPSTNTPTLSTNTSSTNTPPTLYKYPNTLKYSLHSRLLPRCINTPSNLHKNPPNAPQIPPSTNTLSLQISTPSHHTKDFARPHCDGSLTSPPGSQLAWWPDLLPPESFCQIINTA